MKTTKSPPETRASASAHGMKMEGVVDEVEPATSSTLSEEEKISMRKPIKKMASFRVIYDADFRNLVEKHQLGVGEDLSRKVDLVLVGPPHNL